MSQEDDWILCRKCGKKLAKDKGDHLEVMSGHRSVRIYHAVVVAIDCERCGFTLDLPVDKRKGVKV